jgi:hypothetical protein
VIDSFTVDAGLADIAPVLDQWQDEVVPRDVPPHPHATYSPRYAWMFAYEKDLKRRLVSAIGGPLGPWEPRLFGADGALSEGLSNAFLHGHRRQPDLPILVRCWVGGEGFLIAVSDQGPGFAVEAALRRLRSGAGYFHVAGNGLRSLAAAPGIRASWVDGGRTLVLLVPLSAGSAHSGGAPPART